MMLVPRRAKGLALTFPPTAKEALIGFILFDVTGIAFFGRIVVLIAGAHGENFKAAPSDHLFRQA